MRHHEYEVSEEDFDKYTEGMSVVNSVTAAEDGYRLYGDNGLSSNVKFKMTDNGVISVIIMQPDKVLCYTCDLEFKTEKHQESCPLCGKSIYSILDTNRRFQDSWNVHQAQVDREFKARLVNDQVDMLAEYGLLAPEKIEEEKQRLLAIHVPNN
jgi:hypothetical protein